MTSNILLEYIQAFFIEKDIWLGITCSFKQLKDSKNARKMVQDELKHLPPFLKLWIGTHILVVSKEPPMKTQMMKDYRTKSTILTMQACVNTKK